MEPGQTDVAALAAAQDLGTPFEHHLATTRRAERLSFLAYGIVILGPLTTFILLANSFLSSLPLLMKVVVIILGLVLVVLISIAGVYCITNFLLPRLKHYNEQHAVHVYFCTEGILEVSNGKTIGSYHWKNVWRINKNAVPGTGGRLGHTPQYTYSLQFIGGYETTLHGLLSSYWSSASDYHTIASHIESYLRSWRNSHHSDGGSSQE